MSLPVSARFRVLAARLLVGVVSGLVVLAISLAIVPSALAVLPPGGLATSPWPKFGNDSLHTALSAYSGPSLPDEKWAFATSDVVQSSPAIGSDGTVYVGSYDGKFYAFNSDGTKKWDFATGGDVFSSPAIGSDGTVYVGRYDNKLYAINPDGTEKWAFTTASTVLSSPAIGSDGTVYVGSYDNTLYAVNPDGTEKWQFATGNAVQSSPAIGSDGTVYVGSDDNKLYAINPDGTEKWNFATGDDVFSSPAIGSDGTVYVGSWDCNLYAINPDGTEKWAFATGNAVLSSPAIGSDATVYVGSWDNNVYAVNPDGTEKWTFLTGDRVTSSPAIGSDGTVYVGSTDDSLYAIDPDGTEKWQFVTGNDVFSSPAIGTDGTVYVGSADTKLHAIGPMPDTTPPTTSITLDPVAGPSGWANTDVAFSLTATDGPEGSGVADSCYRIDGGADTTYTASPVTISAEGLTTVDHWSLDAAGNVESAETTTIQIDKTSPATSSDATTTYSGYAAIQMTASDALSGVAATYYSYDGGLTSFAGSVVSTTAPGAHILTYWSVDAAGNVEFSHDAAFFVTPISLATSPWPKFGHDLLHTGRSPYSGPSLPVEKWAFATGSNVWSSPAIGSDGTVYVGSYDGKVYAIDPDGAKKWEFATGSYVQSSPAIGSDGTVYVGSGDHKLYAINADGTKKWEFATGSYVLSSPAIAPDGTVYVGSHDGKVYAINPDGTQQWAFVTGDVVYSCPAIGSDGTVYVGSNDHKLYAINPDGTEQWAFATAGWVESSPAIGSDGTVYVGSRDNNLYAINPDGTQQWAFTTGNDVDSSPAIGTDGTVYIGSYDRKVYAINADGTKKWEFVTGGWILSTFAIGFDGTIYASSLDYNIYAIDPDGSEKWAFAIGGQMTSSPAIGADGTVYVGCNSDYKLHAIGQAPDTTPPTTSITLDPAAASSSWVNTDVAFSLTATDGPDGSGAADSYYRLDGGGDTTCTASPVTVSDEGLTTIEYWSVDASGNVESAETTTVMIDKTSPVTSSDATTTYDGNAMIQLTPTDAVSGVAETYYSFDGGLTTIEGSTTGTTTPGAYVLTYWSVDAAGNVEFSQVAAFEVTAISIAPTSGPNGSISPPTTQTVDHGAGQTFTMLPDTGYHVSTITIDGSAETTTATSYTFANLTASHTIRVEFANSTPVAAPWSGTTSENASASVSAPGLLAGATDADGDSLTATLAAGPSHGVLTVNDDGSFAYVPNPYYNGSDSFDFRVRDGAAYSATQTASIAVTAINYPPSASDWSGSGAEDTTLTAAAPGLLTGIADPDPEDSVTATLVTGPSHGALAVNADGSFSYKPSQDYAGLDSFTFRAGDGQVYSATRTASITVSPVNDFPVAMGESYSTPFGHALVVPSPGVLANDTDVENDSLTATVAAGPAHGTLTLAATGGLTYTPGAGYAGPDSFTYRAFDGLVYSNAATVALTVLAGLAPTDIALSNGTVAENLSSATTVGTLSAIDPDSASFTYSIAGGAGAASFAIVGNQLRTAASFDFEAQATYHVTIRADDGSGGTLDRPFTITVTNVNEEPAALPWVGVMLEDATMTVAAPGLLQGATDPESGALTAVLTAAPLHGVIVVRTDGSFTYAPAPGYHGPDWFTFKASDGTLLSPPRTATIVVSDVDHAPVATADSFSTAYVTTLTVDAPGVLGNDTESDGEDITCALDESASHGTLSLNDDGSLEYVPAWGFAGDDTFSYHATDGDLSSDIVSVTVHVAAPISSMSRNGGADRYEVARNVCAVGFPGYAGIHNLVIVSGSDRAAADPISAGAIAGLYDAPILLVREDRAKLPDATIAALTAISAANTGTLQVHVIGGVGSVPERLKTEITRYAPRSKYERIAGADRYEVAANVARRVKSVLTGRHRSVGAVFVANAQSTEAMYTALALAPIAAHDNMPVLLVRSTSVPSSIASAMKDLGVASKNRYSAGSTKLVSAAVMTSLGVPAGNRIVDAYDTSRYGTAGAIAEKAVAKGWLDPDHTGLANALPDSLTGGALMGRLGGPLLYTDAGVLSDSTQAYFEAHALTVVDLQIFGGWSSISDSVADQAKGYLH